MDDRDAVFFETPADLRDWLEAHHATTDELLIGFYKKSAGKAGITYAEALDEALCFGWIDAVRRSIDGEWWTIRFTPRKPRSIWSAVNIKRAEELRALGLMKAAGLKAFEKRIENRSRVYAYEQGVMRCLKASQSASKRTRAPGRTSRRRAPTIATPPSGG